jgi:hypothetical protein
VKTNFETLRPEIFLQNIFWIFTFLFCVAFEFKIKFQAKYIDGPHGDIFVMGGKSVDYPDAPKNSKLVRYSTSLSLLSRRF